jgi:putative FmdB family regulatory protein
MPVYEYCCQACGHEFEREQRITEDPIKTCPKCRAARAKRMISRTSFVLKGGGWYSDLYASSGGDAKKGDADAKGGDSSPKDGKEPKGGADAGSKKSDKKGGGKGGSKSKGKGGSSKSSKGAKGSAAA